MEVDILNIPKLRFKEFTDEWVYYKYKDIFNLNQGLQIPITERFLDYAPNRFFYITNEFLKPSSKKSYYIENPSPNVICTKEDILMTRTGNTGKVITNIAGVFHNNFFRIKYNPKNFNKDFICCILNQNKIQNKILTLAGSSTIPDLNHKDFYSIKSRFPKLKEQEKIAKFINTVDKKKENIENTISSLENQKKGLLQQIFSQKLRFKDENGNNYPNWEKKKLGDIATLKNGISKSNEAFGHGKKFINLQDIFNKSYIFNDNYSLVDVTEKELSENNLLKGDVLFVRSSVKREGVGLPCVIMENLIDTVYSGFIIRCRFNINENIYLHYKKYCFLEFSFRKALLKKSSSSANTNINQDNLSKLYVKLPCLEEQTKIADFLSAFDRKLDNQKAQLEHWQQIKKGLLQQMFV